MRRRHVPADGGRRARDAAGASGQGRAVRRRGRAVPSLRRRPDRDPPVALDPFGRRGAAVGGARAAFGGRGWGDARPGLGDASRREVGRDGVAFGPGGGDDRGRLGDQRDRAEAALPHARRTRAPRGAVPPRRPRARGAAPRTDGSVRGTARGPGAEGRGRAPHVAVVRRPRVRRAGGGRARRERPRTGVGPRGLPGLHGDPRGPGGRAPRGGRAVRRSSTWSGWGSVGGRSAGSWRRWRCCGGRTCSARAWSARR